MVLYKKNRLLCILLQNFNLKLLDFQLDENFFKTKRDFDRATDFKCNQPVFFTSKLILFYFELAATRAMLYCFCSYIFETNEKM